MQEYADPVIDWLDGGRGYFAKKLYREVRLASQMASFFMRQHHPLQPSHVPFSQMDRIPKTCL